jgi:hypothetical protein
MNRGNYYINQSNNWSFNYTVCKFILIWKVNAITLCDHKKNGKVIRKVCKTYFRIELKQNYQREVTEKQGGSSYFNILTKISAFLL